MASPTVLSRFYVKWEPQISYSQRGILCVLWRLGVGFDKQKKKKKKKDEKSNTYAWRDDTN